MGGFIFFLAMTVFLYRNRGCATPLLSSVISPRSLPSPLRPPFLLYASAASAAGACSGRRQRFGSQASPNTCGVRVCCPMPAQGGIRQRGGAHGRGGSAHGRGGITQACRRCTPCVRLSHRCDSLSLQRALSGQRDSSASVQAVRHMHTRARTASVAEAAACVCARGGAQRTGERDAEVRPAG